LRDVPARGDSPGVHVDRGEGYRPCGGPLRLRDFHVDGAGYRWSNATSEVSAWTGTDDLRSEHRAVARMLDIMDGLADSARRGEPLSTDDLSEIVEFLRVFVDRCHHTKEEQLLFPAIHAARLMDAQEAVDGLLADHVKGREAVSQIAVLVPRIGSADESTRAELAEAISGYTQLLRAHIVREERDCFDPADRGPLAGGATGAQRMGTSGSR